MPNILSRIVVLLINDLELVRFMINSPDLGKDIDYNEESDLRVDFKKTLRNSQQNSK